MLAYGLCTEPRTLSAHEHTYKEECKPSILVISSRVSGQFGQEVQVNLACQHVLPQVSGGRPQSTVRLRVCRKSVDGDLKARGLRLG